jgi:glycosyltransferase involved in cell wall biosynthesis
MSGHAALAAARPAGIPVVQTFHALGVVKQRHQGARDTSPPARLAVERQILHEVDHVIATCSDEVFELRRMGLDPGRATIVPCGVDTAHFNPKGRAERRPPGRRRLLCVGRLVERKGLGDAVAALASLPDTDLVVAGGPAPAELDGDDEVRRLRSVAARLGVADRVDFRGRVDRRHLPALLRSADAVVCVPWYEPFGIVPLEAMACSVPVVASAVGGLTDTVVDGVTGVHVPPRRPDVLAGALADLLADPVRLRALGAAGWPRVQRYRWSRIAADTLGVYQEVVAARARRRTTGSALAATPGAP